MKNLFAFFVCIAGFSGFSQSFQVGHTTINFTDANRNNRVIQTEIYYPASVAGTDVAMAAGQFPVVVFGHGFVMVWSAYQNLWDSIVPRGYIMAFPRTEGNISPSHGEFGKDLKFLVGAMQNEGSSSSSLFYNGVSDKSAIMGHSMGGGSSLLAAANNTNIETVICFAPAETNPSAIGAADSITVDALIMVGAQDGVAPPASHGIPMYDTLGSSCKTFISITGGAHCYFALSNFNCDFGENSSSTGISISRAQQQDVTIDFVSLWLDYKLKGNCSAFSVFNDSLDASPRITHQQNCQANPIPAITNNGGTLQSTAGLGYQWYLNGNIVPGANSQQFSPAQDGTYSVEVFYSNGCPEMSAGYLFCSGNSPVITESNGVLSSSTAATYQWFFNGNPIAGETNQSYTMVLGEGNYSVETTLGGCTAVSGNFFLDCSSFVPLVSENGGILSSSAGVSYQWYLNGNPVSGANASQYTPAISGNYSVEVSFANGCAEMSSAVFFSVVGLEEKPAGGKMTVFPNPADERISVLFYHAKGGAVKISVQNCLGQTQKYFSEFAEDGFYSRSIDVSGFPAGLYFVIVDGEDTHLATRFLKQ